MRSKSWLNWGQLVIFGLAAPFFLFPSIRLVWLFLIFPLFAVIQKLVRKQFFERTILDWAILILIIQVALTCFIVDSVIDALPKISGFFYSVAIFYTIVGLLKTEKLVKWGVFAFLAGGLGFSVLSILGMFRYNVKNFDVLFDLSNLLPQINFNIPGAKQGFNPNAVGGVLILFVPLFVLFFVSYFWKDRKAYQYFSSGFFKYFLLIGLFVTFSALLLTQSRGSWLGLVLSLTVVLFFGRRKKKYAVLALVVLLTLFVIFIGFNKIPKQTEGAKERLIDRISLWNFAVETISKYPVTGFGMNQIRQHIEIGHEIAHVHNHFLHTAAELGLPALVALLSILMCCGIMCVDIWKNADKEWMRIAALGLGCGQFSHMIFGLGDSVPFGAKIGIFFWISLALIAVIYNRIVGYDE